MDKKIIIIIVAAVLLVGFMGGYFIVINKNCESDVDLKIDKNSSLVEEDEEDDDDDKEALMRIKGQKLNKYTWVV